MTSDDPSVAGRTSLDAALRAGAEVLACAGVPSPRVDVELLAAHLRGTSVAQVRLDAVLGRPAPDGLAELVERRAHRVPLQHLTGSAPFRDLDLKVGAGVFVPRPETEQVAQVAIDAAGERVASHGSAVVVDLCTGSAAIALAVATEVPAAVVHAVELDAAAHAWAAHNVAALSGASPHAGASADAQDAVGALLVRLVHGDARTALRELDGTVDVVVSNPPYIPPGAVPVDPEVRDHDPAVALYGLGADGLEVPRGVVAAAARLLRAGGVLVMEHAEVQAAPARAMVAEAGWFADVVTRQDLTGRDRMVVARRTGLRAGPPRAHDVKDSRP